MKSQMDKNRKKGQGLVRLPSRSRPPSGPMPKEIRCHPEAQDCRKVIRLA